MTAQIINAILGVVEICPPELASDIAQRGIVLSGGGSLIYGMEQLIEAKTGLQGIVVEQALEAVALGAGKSVEFMNRLQKNK